MAAENSSKSKINSRRSSIVNRSSGVWTIPTLLGHADVKTTEIYTHVAKGVGAMGVVSPLDRLETV
jgi:hypothetical protein